jgi:hypothetical protein
VLVLLAQSHWDRTGSFFLVVESDAFATQLSCVWQFFLKHRYTLRTERQVVDAFFGCVFLCNATNPGGDESAVLECDGCAVLTVITQDNAARGTCLNRNLLPRASVLATGSQVRCADSTLVVVVAVVAVAVFLVVAGGHVCARCVFAFGIVSFKRHNLLHLSIHVVTDWYNWKSVYRSGLCRTTGVHKVCLVY